MLSRFSIDEQTPIGSFPIDVVVCISIQPCILVLTCLPTHPMKCDLRLPAVDIVFSTRRTASEDASNSSLVGLSFSLHMKDFKLHVYHPFSGDTRAPLFDGTRAGQSSKRNALALSVNSVSINISRTRSALIDEHGQTMNTIQLSVIAQISKATFQYDIRHFADLLAFPKIWYKRKLARRLFLGDENVSSSIRVPPTVAAARPVSLPVNKSVRRRAHVLLALRLEELHVSMNMSNIMGTIEWNTRDVRSTASIKLTNSEERVYAFSLGLKNSVFQAEEGFVGGLIRLKNLRTTGKLSQYDEAG